MAFIIDKEELKSGLIIFRRGDVDHRNFYCRIKLPKADRYKTISLKTADLHEARERAYDFDADIRFRLKHEVPIFNKPFRDACSGWHRGQSVNVHRKVDSSEAVLILLQASVSRLGQLAALHSFQLYRQSKVQELLAMSDNMVLPRGSLD